MNSLAILIEQAGGGASTGNSVDVVPEKLHQRAALIIGKDDVAPSGVFHPM